MKTVIAASKRISNIYKEIDKLETELEIYSELETEDSQNKCFEIYDKITELNEDLLTLLND